MEKEERPREWEAFVRVAPGCAGPRAGEALRRSKYSWSLIKTCQFPDRWEEGIAEGWMVWRGSLIDRPPV